MEIQLRNELETLQNEKRQRNGHSQTKEKIRSGLARLVEKDLRKQLVMLEQSNRQKTDEIRSLSTQLKVKLGVRIRFWATSKSAPIG